MPVNINLLPTNLRKKSSLIKAYGNFKKINIIGALLFFASILVITVVVFINGREIKDLNTQTNVLKKKVETLSSVESKYVVLKDRANKLKKVDEKGNVRYKEYYNFLTNQASGIEVGEAEISRSSFDFLALAPSTREAMSFFDSLSEENKYKDIFLSSLTYKNGGGYAFELKFAF